MTKHYKTNRKVSKKIDEYQADTDSDVEPAPKKTNQEREELGNQQQKNANI